MRSHSAVRASARRSAHDQANKSPARAGGDLRVPLIMPVDADLAGNSLTLMSGGEQQADVADGDWVSVDDAAYGAGAARNEWPAGGSATGPAGPGWNTGYPRSGLAAGSRNREFSCPRLPATCVLKLRGEGGDGALVVERALLQTRLSQTSGAHGTGTTPIQCPQTLRRGCPGCGRTGSSCNS